jgi:hypothetical protein
VRYVLALGLVAILALATIGVTSAAWAQEIAVEGVVEIGTVDAGLAVISVSDSVPPPKKYASAAVSPDGQTITVTLPRFNPQYYAWVEIAVENTGSLPLRVEGFWLDAPDELEITPFGLSPGVSIGPGDTASPFGFEIMIPHHFHEDCEVTITVDYKAWFE